MTSFLYRSAAVLASLIFFAAASYAVPILTKPSGGRDLTGLRYDRPRLIVDVTCTDSFNTPATTVNVDVRTLTNVDTMAEAVNPDRNINDAVQTSGSADGWCDSQPWVMKGAHTGTGTIFFGPLKNVPYQGFLLNWNFTAAFGNYQFSFCHKNLYDVAVCQQDGTMTATASLGAQLGEVTPITSSAGSQYTSFDNFWFPQGREFYMRLNFAAAGAYTYSVEIVPLIPYYLQRGE